jgi:hypothetical protein
MDHPQFLQGSAFVNWMCAGSSADCQTGKEADVDQHP